MSQCKIHKNTGFFLTFLFFDRKNECTVANKHMLEIMNANTRKRRQICSKLTIKTSEQRRSGVFILIFEHILLICLLFLLLILNR